MIRFLQTPSPTKKVVLGGLLILICAAMVYSMIPGGVLSDATSSVGSGVVAKVAGQEVTALDVQNQAKQMIRQQFPRGGIPEQYMNIFMRQASRQAADALIMRNAITYEADRMGLSTSDAELRYELEHGPIARELFPGGNFIGQQAYESTISNQYQMSVAQFEQEVKRTLTIRKLRSAIEGGVTASNAELMTAYNQQNVKVKFDYAVLTMEDVTKGINPSDSELKAFYEQNKQSYANSIPEQRKARFIAITPTSLPNPPKVTQQDLESYYRQHQDEFRVPESVTVRHILIKTPQPGPDGKVDQKAVDTAKTKAEEILKQIKAGGNFAELAKKNSDDPSSAKEGGLISNIVKGQTVAPFEQAAFNTPKGQVVGPVQTSFGFHVIKVEDKVSAHLKPLDEVKSQIEPILAQQKIGADLERISRNAEAAARTQGLDKAAAANGLQIVNTDFFAQGASLPGVGNSPEFMSAVFSQKPNSPPQAVRIASGYAVVQGTDLKPAATPTFEEIKQQVAQQFKQQRAQTALAQKVQELADRARAEHNLKSAAKALGATLKTSDLVSPGAQVPQIGALSGQAAQIFDMKAGEISQPIPANGSGVVMQLVEKQEPNPADFEKQKDQIRQAVLEQKRGQVMELWASNLRDRLEKDGKIKINQKELAKLAGPSGPAGPGQE